jgi:hypothetical protein
VVRRECGVEVDALKVRLELHKVGAQRCRGLPPFFTNLFFS